MKHWGLQTDNVMLLIYTGRESWRSYPSGWIHCIAIWQPFQKIVSTMSVCAKTHLQSFFAAKVLLPWNCLYLFFSTNCYPVLLGLLLKLCEYLIENVIFFQDWGCLAGLVLVVHSTWNFARSSRLTWCFYKLLIFLVHSKLSRVTQRSILQLRGKTIWQS